MGLFASSGSIVLYLDQCAFCNVIDPAGISNWLEISRLIEKGTSNGSLVIPLSVDHFLETAAGPEPARFRRRLDEMRRLSNGNSFVTPERLAALELFANVREVKVRRDQVVVETDPVLFEFDQQFLMKVRNDAGAHFLAINSRYNMLRNRDDGARKYLSRPVEKMAKARARKSFAEIADLLRKRMRYEVALADIEQEGVQSTEANIVSEILSLPHSQPDLVMVAQFLDRESDEVVSSVNVGKQLMLEWNKLQRDFEDNDYFDFSRMKVSVPCADVIVTDSEMAAAVCRAGLDRRYDTKVFSCKAQDLGRLIDELGRAVG